MIHIQKFYFVDCGNNKLGLKQQDFNNGPLPLIWHNQGLYGVIGKEKMENLISLLRDLSKLPTLNQTIVLLFWDDAQIIDSKLGKILTNF